MSIPQPNCLFKINELGISLNVLPACVQLVLVLEQNIIKSSINPYCLEFRCMQKIKSVSLKKQCVGQKHSAVIFVEGGNILDWFNQAIEKIWQWSAI